MPRKLAPIHPGAYLRETLEELARRTESGLALLHPAGTHRCYDARPDPVHSAS